MRGLFNRLFIGMLIGVVLFAGVAHAVSEKEVVEKTTTFLEELNSRDGFSGAVLIAKDGVPILKKAYGYANRSFNVPNQIDTKFNLGSMNKMFTATAVMQLVEQDEISLEGKIIDYVPDYPNKDVATRVTVHQLLTHTSGMGSYWTDEYFNTSKDLFRDVADYLPLFVDQPLEHEPGAKFTYSNAGYIVLGLIIEQITGRNYFDYVMDNIFKPAGMTNTDSYELDYVVPNLAVGYTLESAEKGKVKNNLFIHVCKGGPAGGGYSTVEDLLKFSTALMNGKLLSAEYAELATTGKSKINKQMRYGYGFIDRMKDGQRIISNGGGFPGISTNMEIYVNLGYTVIVLSNFDDGSVEVEDFVRKQLIE